MKTVLFKTFIVILSAVLCLGVLAGCTVKTDPMPEQTEKNTEDNTEVGTDVPTDAPTEVPTENSSEEPTTEAPTDEPSEEPTAEVPTEEPTEGPTDDSTEEPTEDNTEVPTDGNTEAPTEDNTEKPTLTPSEGLEYIYVDGICALWRIGTCTDTDIVVADTWEGHTVIGVAAEAFANNTEITSIVLPDSAKIIGDGAFYGCTSLVSVTLSSYTTKIGEKAFYGCTALVQITLPETVTTIENDAFYGCSALEYNTYGNAQYIGTRSNPYLVLVAAVGTDITSCQIHENAKFICSGAFEGCVNLTAIVIPNGITSIGKNAFGGCVAIVNISYSGTKEAWENISKNSGWCNDVGDKTIHCDDGDVIETIDDENGNKPIEEVTGDKTDEPSEELEHLEFKLDDETGTYIVTGIGTCTGTDIVVPSMYNGKAVTGIGNKAFYMCRNLTSITISDSVTWIGDEAFYECKKITSIDIPDSVTSIGERAFYWCSSLTSINIPDGVTSISKNAFYYCKGLTSINIPNSVTSIGSSAFEDCKGLTSVTIPDSVTSIGNGAFSYCSSLTSINIPDGVTSIGNFLLSHCSSLTNITIPDSVTSIGEYAFYECSSFTSIVIPNSVTSIGEGAFSGCSSLTSISVPFIGATRDETSNTFFAYLFGASDKYRPDYYIPSSLKTVVITGSTCIANNAFDGCAYITSVTIGNGVTSIGEYAFYDCSSLTSVTIGSGVTSIGNCAFYNCSSLTSINIPDGVTSIGSNAFVGCSNLEYNVYDNANYLGNENNQYLVLIKAFDAYFTSCQIYEGTRFIQQSAFKNRTSLESIIIPNSVTSIGYGAFEGCSSLTSMTIPFLGSNVDGSECFGYFFGASIYGDNSSYVPQSLTTVIITGGTQMSGYAFYGCRFIESISLPDSVTNIGDGAFYGCSRLKSMIIPDGVTSIGKNTFYDCTSLADITIPNGVTSIGESAFKGCWGLTSITIPVSVTNIGKNALSCSKLVDIQYSGTKEQWSSISKVYGWNDGTGSQSGTGESYTVHCTDGDLTKAES